MQKLGELERSTLSANIAEILRENIVTGELAPGVRLIEAELARQLGVSRGPLREALRVLETEGLLENHPGRGSFVTQFSARDIREVYSLRSVLEEEAIRRAASNCSERDLDQLQAILDAMFKAAKDGDPSKVTDLDFEFHTLIWEIADHHLLKQTLQGITTQIRMFLAVQTHLYADLPEGISDHQHLMESLKDQDGERGAQIMRTHLHVAEDVVLEQVRGLEEEVTSSAV
jgi:DNA-binding GntR family transcriptional regulator